MTSHLGDPAIRSVLAGLVRPSGAADWEDVLRRALLAAEGQKPLDVPGPRAAAVGDQVAADCTHGREPPPEEQGWGTRPIRFASSREVAVPEGMGWGTRPM
jgi:hypothetical protein